MISKQDSKERWTLDNTYNGKYQINIEEKGKPIKWITLRALRILKKLYD